MAKTGSEEMATAAKRRANIPALGRALVAAILCTVVGQSFAATCGDGLREEGEDGNLVCI